MEPQTHAARSGPGKKPSVHPDGYAWVKYGEKRLTPSRMVREYYRCKSWRDCGGVAGTGCPAKKVVDRPCLQVEGGDAKDPKKRSRAVFPRHSPCQSPEYSQHNHPPLAAPMAGAAVTASGGATESGGCSRGMFPSGGGLLSPCASSMASPSVPGHWMSTPSPHHSVGYTDSPSPRPASIGTGHPQGLLGGPSAAAAVLSNCIQALAASAVGAATQAGNSQLPSPCATPSSGKRPALPPLLIPESVPEASALTSPALPTTASARSQGNLNSGPRKGEMLQAAAAWMLSQTGSRDPDGQSQMTGGEHRTSTLLRALLPQASGPSSKKQRLSPPCDYSPLSPDQSDTTSLRGKTPHNPQRASSSGTCPTPTGGSWEGSAFAPSRTATPGVPPASPSSMSGIQQPAKRSSLDLSELPDDALLSLLEYLSGQIATSIGKFPATQLAMLLSQL